MKQAQFDGVLSVVVASNRNPGHAVTITIGLRLEATTTEVRFRSANSNVVASLI